MGERRVADALGVMRKGVRTALFQTPGIYDLWTSQARYRVHDALHLVHEADFRALPSLLPMRSPLVLDVGGNLGQSVLAVRRMLPTARIITFEPNPAHLPALQRLARQDPSVTVEAVGLGAADAEETLHVPVYKGKTMTGLASFDEAEARGWVSPRTVFRFQPELLSLQQIRMSVRRLDDFGLQPDFIKMDVQGYEEAVVRGGLETIRRCRPVILGESVPPDGAIMALLEPLGYAMYEWYRGRLRDYTGATMNRFMICDATREESGCLPAPLSAAG